ISGREVKPSEPTLAWPAKLKGDESPLSFLFVYGSWRRISVNTPSISCNARVTPSQVSRHSPNGPLPRAIGDNSVMACPRRMRNSAAGDGIATPAGSDLQVWVCPCRACLDHGSTPWFGKGLSGIASVRQSRWRGSPARPVKPLAAAKYRAVGDKIKFGENLGKNLA